MCRQGHVPVNIGGKPVVAIGGLASTGRRWTRGLRLRFVQKTLDRYRSTFEWRNHSQLIRRPVRSAALCVLWNRQTVDRIPGDQMVGRRNIRIMLEKIFQESKTSAGSMRREFRKYCSLISDWVEVSMSKRLIFLFLRVFCSAWHQHILASGLLRFAKQSAAFIGRTL